MESINKLIELSAVYREMADKFIEMNKELVFRNANAEERVRGLIEANKKLTSELSEAIKETEYQFQEKLNRTQELEQRTQELEDALKHITELDLFIAILAHDLKNPFTVLMGLSELISENIYHKPLDEIAHQAKILKSSADSANSLLNSILMWVKNRTESIPFKPREISLSDIGRRTIEPLSVLAKEKQIEVNFSTADVITADSDMLQAILRNLITNAIKYTPQKGRIDITSEIRNHDVVITVADNGVGIDPERLNNLFDISKVKSTSGTEHEKGTGLGLIICKQFVERHGGNLWVESETGKGSRFRFSIPVHVNQLNPVTESSSSR